MSVDMSDPNDPVVAAALSRSCPVCKAGEGDWCTNTINRDKPLPGRRVTHYGRIERWDVP